MNTINTAPNNLDQHIAAALAQVKERSDRYMNWFLGIYSVTGLVLAGFYDTWFVAIALSACSLTAYYTVKAMLPKSNLYQYVLSAVLGVFMAQFIYQMHGMFEMHFFAFIACTILITYQNWRLQIPILAVVVLHHAAFGYFQYLGYKDIFFSQLEYMDLQTFVIHALLAAVIMIISGLWAYTLRQNTISNIEKTFKLGSLEQQEAHNLELAVINTELEMSYKMTKEANEQLKIEMNERALQAISMQKLNDSLDQFAYIVSHDLKAPLRGINTLAEMISEELATHDKIDTDTLNSIGLLQNRVRRMEGMIDGILRYTRLRETEELKKINANDMVTAVLDMLQIPEGMEIQVQENLPIISCEPVKMEQIFTNIIGNGIKYHHTKCGTIRVECQEEGAFHRFSITDDGPGIAPAYLDKVFDIFQTLNARDKVESTGIGLTIVKKIIEEAGGKVWVESELGKGASFIFLWPREGTEKREQRVVGEGVRVIAG